MAAGLSGRPYQRDPNEFLEVFSNELRAVVGDDTWLRFRVVGCVMRRVANWNRFSSSSGMSQFKRLSDTLAVSSVFNAQLTTGSASNPNAELPGPISGLWTIRPAKSDKRV